MNVLICGASFAGLSSAFWLRELGHTVTVVEVAPGLRTGGTAVDIKGATVALVKRMGLLDAIAANRLSLKRWDLVNEAGVTERSMVIRADGQPPSDTEFEVERNVLLALLFAKVKDRAEFVFGDTVTSLTERASGIDVTFKESSPRTFDLVLGCDGMHSTVRKLWFGDEARFTHFLEQYFSITIVEKLLIERDTAQLFNVPGKAVMLNAYKNKTDIILGFVSQTRLPYDHRDEAAQRALITAQFANVGWRTSELLREIAASSSFYFDQLAQIRMPSWSRGRVALVGDAGYCASPAAGMGGSLAIDGAGALGDAMRAHGADFQSAFAAYDASLRPFVEQVQAEAVRTGLESLVPRTEEAIRARNSRTDAEF
ncbi:MAG: FAD-dependent monooxygenase [Archangium sp.]